MAEYLQMKQSCALFMFGKGLCVCVSGIPLVTDDESTYMDILRRCIPCRLHLTRVFDGQPS